MLGIHVADAGHFYVADFEPSFRVHRPIPAATYYSKPKPAVEFGFSAGSGTRGNG